MNDIEHLQEKVAYQEHTIEKLNEALTNQQQQLAILQGELQLLTQLLHEWRNDRRTNHGMDNDSELVHEIPPHY